MKGREEGPLDLIAASCLNGELHASHLVDKLSLDLLVGGGGGGGSNEMVREEEEEEEKGLKIVCCMEQKISGK